MPTFICERTHKMDRSTLTQEKIGQAAKVVCMKTVLSVCFSGIHSCPQHSWHRKSYLFREVEMNQILYETTNLHGLRLPGFHRHPYKVHRVWPILVPMSEFTSSGSEFMWWLWVGFGRVIVLLWTDLSLCCGVQIARVYFQALKWARWLTVWRGHSNNTKKTKQQNNSKKRSSLVHGGKWLQPQIRPLPNPCQCLNWVMEVNIAMDV